METTTEKKEKVYTLDMMFWIKDDEDPLTMKNLQYLVEAAQKRLDEILCRGDLDAFNVVDVESVEIALRNRWRRQTKYVAEDE
tara:strand:+ start:174 stop:422 length:249 start_codon:yes stop_codon:yes gene_type:complete